MADFKYTVTKHVGVLSEKKGYTKEVNYISYSDRPAVLDIRTWHTDEDGKTMQKGITLTEEEVTKLKEMLNEI